MKRINRLSIILSVSFAGLFLLLLIALTFILPALVESLLSAPDLIGDRSDLSPAVKTLILILSYGMIVIAFVAVGFLIALLRSVWKEEVFSQSALTLLSVISWCCFAEGLLFFSIGFWFQLAFLVFAAAFFLGLCLRVVCGVIAEAIRYKTENDLTV